MVKAINRQPELKRMLHYTVKQKQSETFTVQKQNPTEIVQSKILALKLVFAFISNTFGSFDCPSCCQRR
jgi:hypothetical protein